MEEYNPSTLPTKEYHTFLLPYLPELEATPEREHQLLSQGGSLKMRAASKALSGKIVLF